MHTPYHKLFNEVSLEEGKTSYTHNQENWWTWAAGQSQGNWCSSDL